MKSYTDIKTNENIGLKLNIKTMRSIVTYLTLGIFLSTNKMPQ